MVEVLPAAARAQRPLQPQNPLPQGAGLACTGLDFCVDCACTGLNFCVDCAWTGLDFCGCGDGAGAGPGGEAAPGGRQAGEVLD